jgi:hypothetical protein
MNTFADSLQNIIDQLSPILRSQSNVHIRKPLGPEKWSRKQILGHLIDSAANNHQRFVRTLIETPLAFPPYEQNSWVSLQAYQDHDWQVMVDLWSAYNTHFAHIIARIPESEITRECTIGNKPAVTLGWLIGDYLRHLKHHLRQIVDEPSLDILA